MRLGSAAVVSMLVGAALCGGCSKTVHDAVIIGDDTRGGSVRDAKVAVEDELEPEITPVERDEAVEEDQTRDPSSYMAEEVVSDEDILRSGGVDSFFWAEKVTDSVFARMVGRSYGDDCTVPLDDLRYVRVLYVDADNVTHVGELVVNRAVADEVVSIFRELYEGHYPIRRMKLVDDYGADDFASCMDDNTSSFNYRTIAGTSILSNHAFGLAIDINTHENPYYIVSSDYICPTDGYEYLDRTRTDPYMIHSGDLCHTLFTENGWTWGGSWSDPIDYQHFEKPQVAYE